MCILMIYVENSFPCEHVVKDYNHSRCSEGKLKEENIDEARQLRGERHVKGTNTEDDEPLRGEYITSPVKRTVSNVICRNLYI